MPRYRIPFLAGAGVETDDGRIFETITWRTLPLPLAFQTDTQHAHGSTSDVVGQLVDLEEGTDGTVTAIIDVDPRDDNNRAIHPEGARAASMIEQGGQGVSIDGLLPIDATITEECLQEDDDGWCLMMRVRFSEVIIGGATLTPIPAYSQAIVDPTPLGADNQPLEQAGDDEALALGLVASAAAAPVPALVARSGFALTAGAAVDLAGWALDPAHFTVPPELSLDANHINLDDDGRIWGFIAPGERCHQSFADRCVLANDQSRDLSNLLSNTIPVGEGRVPVAFLTMDTGHATTAPGTSAAAAAAHYDDTGSIAAIFTAGWWGEHVWFSGSRSPLLNDWQLTVLAAGYVSGDWRAEYGERERTLRAALVVPVGGFQLRRPPLAASSAPVPDAAGCSCGGGAHAAGDAARAAARAAALARLADERLAVDLAALDATVLDGLPASL